MFNLTKTLKNFFKKEHPFLSVAKNFHTASHKEREDIIHLCFDESKAPGEVLLNLFDVVLADRRHINSLANVIIERNLDFLLYARSGCIDLFALYCEEHQRRTLVCAHHLLLTQKMMVLLLYDNDGHIVEEMWQSLSRKRFNDDCAQIKQAARAYFNKIECFSQKSFFPSLHSLSGQRKSAFHLVIKQCERLGILDDVIPIPNTNVNNDWLAGLMEYRILFFNSSHF